MEKLKGIGVFSDIVFGKGFVWKNFFLLSQEYKIPKKDIKEEINKLDEAIKKTIEEITALKKNLEESIGKEYADIFNFHLSILQDKNLRDETVKIIKEEQLNVESSLKKVIFKLGEIFGKSEKDFLKDRRRDILDVVEKIVSNLKDIPSMKVIGEGEIIVADDLSPSQIVALNRKLVKGIVTDIGSETSHIAIMVRALEIPSVIGVGEATKVIKTGDGLIVDGEEGIVIVNPTNKVINEYKKKKEELKKKRKKISLLKNLKCKTKDRKEIKLFANIAFPEEIIVAEKNGYDGIGLYRTEYLYINRKNLPDEEEQFYAYKNIAERVKNKPVIIRTIDIGGDKILPGIFEKKETNPFLGWRGIRFCLDRRDIFETQIKAILRASVYGEIKIMFPMVATLEEVIEGKKIIEDVKKKLKRENKKFKEIELGTMIEIPSAALISDKLAKEVDFFSIGSNDLIQFTLAVDRLNEKITHLYQPCHPSVLKMVKLTIENAEKNKIQVGICGEMASIPDIACLLVGMGIDELSMAPISIPLVKEKLINKKYQDLKEISEEVFKFNTNNEIINFLKEELK
ncbi:MAG TPA: phosphoenolpyruvate--protein phosphotransferase [Candidatus Ratteibacteria bacterium]|nr:phosphoenolpyruvate--protein phosphotransferase [Candidatus Ratteibacteria bacterium]